MNAVLIWVNMIYAKYAKNLHTNYATCQEEEICIVDTFTRHIVSYNITTHNFSVSHTSWHVCLYFLLIPPPPLSSRYEGEAGEPR